MLSGADWRGLPGVAYLGSDGRFVINPPAPKVADLDGLPFMARDTLERYLKKYGPPLPASLEFGRGCTYRCTFCTVRSFEALQPGPHHRQRSVESVVAEIRWLHERYGITEFNFEDDNLVVPSRAGRDKLHRLAEALKSLGFPLSFTFFCRPDAVEPELFRHLTEAGLCGVYLGIESVYGPDLEFFNKGLTLEAVYRALGTLAGLGFSPAVGARRRLMLGYIMWHPLSSFEQLRTSIRFIREQRAPPKLARRALRLYTGIPVKARLERLGLLDPSRPSGWCYADPRLACLEAAVNRYFSAVNEVRDRVRTVEKAVERYGRSGPASAGMAPIREELDGRCLDFFEEACDVAEGLGSAGPTLEARVGELEAERLADLAQYLDRGGVSARLDAAFRELDLPPTALDLFRK
ncbi:MAG: radical SAM protein [Acetobacteraceae bacterium]|nr:radical SAM protein [Acetobacteraceae bacterium]